MLGRLLARLPRIDLAHIRLAVRATVAALLAYGIAWWLDLPKGYWAVLSAILVVQSSLGASVAVATDRGLGTIAGGIIGVGLAMIAGPSQDLTVLLLTIGTLATALLAAYRPSFKLAPVTVVVVMLSDPTHAQPLISGLQRVFEIALGGAVGVACALFVFPARALFLLFPNAADAIDACAALLEEGRAGLLDGTLDPAEIDRLNAGARVSLRAADLRVGEARRERAGWLAGPPDAAPIVRTCRRLWHSVIILLRVADAPLPTELVTPVRATLQAALGALATECRDIAESLRSGNPVGLGSASDSAEAMSAAVAALQAEMDRAGTSGLLKGDGASLTRLYTAVAGCVHVQENLMELRVQLAAYRADQAERAVA
ncbi:MULTISPECIES: FUSC family protein [Azorhizobium]|uniref:FUSC family protein n=3 Tax=Xanthobacteraceae TaxID=335928 RepID=UPI0010CFD61A|nr:FUSC family protein [Azorhizobium sp. AG788]TDT91359.1 fusaric acid resistance family protein [Azorhizobium sp. AG788]